MPIDNSYNDGGLQSGSSVLTIIPKLTADDASQFPVIGDSEFNFEDEAKEVDQTDQFGKYNGGFGIQQKLKGTCTVQLPSGRRIEAGYLFTSDVVTDKVPPNTLWQISKASNPFEKEGYRKQSISYFKRKFGFDNVTLQP